MVANKDGGNNDRALLKAIRDTFLLIASPFVPYQQSLAEVERDPLGEPASIVARDIRSVNSLQDSSERLGDLAPFMFPLAQGNSHELLHAFSLIIIFPHRSFP
jgi:hypothetical protein